MPLKEAIIFRKNKYILKMTLEFSVDKNGLCKYLEIMNAIAKDNLEVLSGEFVIDEVDQ